MRFLKYLAALLLLVGCGPKSGSPTLPIAQLRDPATGLNLPNGYTAEIIAKGLNWPTHVAVGPDGAFYITQLNGGENDGKGQVVKVAAPGAAPEVVLDGLYKPTGLTWAAGALYITAGNSVLVSQVKDGKLQAPTTLFKDIPFNGRSIGQIAIGPDGLLYFQSTGNENIWRDSGIIYTAKPDGSERNVFARGFKNAYALAWDAKSGQMYATEIGDGVIQGVGQFPEEVNVIRRGGHYGWPQCYGKQEENEGIGGNRNICADTDPALATFPPQTTPTGLAVLDGKLIVALWNGNDPRLVSVDPTSGTVSEFARGFKRAIALLAPPNGGLLVVDMDGGILYRLTKKAP